MATLTPFITETETYAKLATYFAQDQEKRKKARDDYAEYLLDTSFSDRQKISQHFIEMAQDNPDKMENLQVTRGLNMSAGIKVFMNEINNIFDNKEEENKQRAQNVLQETDQIFYDLNQLHTASTYLQKTEPEHHKWSTLAAQMTQNKIIDKYNLSLEKNDIVVDLTDNEIENIITYYRGNPDELNDIMLSRSDNFPLDSTSEKDAQAYVIINHLCETNTDYYNCFKAICEERYNTNASLSNIIPDNVRTFFKERSDYINQQLDDKNYKNLYQNGNKDLFEAFVNELPSKYDETLQSLVDDYYNGGVTQSSKPTDMVLRARVISTLDGCSQEDAQTILDHKKQTLQPYDTLVLEEPIDFSAFTSLKNEESTTTTETSIREQHQQHQKQSTKEKQSTKKEPTYHQDPTYHQEPSVDYFDSIPYDNDDYVFENDFDASQFEIPTLDQFTL